MLEAVSLVLDLAVLGLAGVLAGAGLSAAVRYHDRRFGLISAGLLILGAVGATGIVNLLSPNLLPAANLGVIPAVLMVVSEVLIYISLVYSNSSSIPK